MSKDGKHHHSPVFYLGQWVGEDRQLCEYKRRHHGVLPKRVFPDKTGYQHGLYNVQGLPPTDRQYVEKKYMSRVDSEAAISLTAMLDETLPPSDFSPRMKVAWARFLYSLTFRSPNVIKRLQAQMDQQIAEGKIKQPEIPFVAAEVFPSMLGSPDVVKELVGMNWVTSNLGQARNMLLTSDRPVIMTNGLLHAEAHIAVPVSPRSFFLAYRTDEMFQLIAAMSQDDLVAMINDKVVRQAVEFVYAFDDSQTDFIAARFGDQVRSTPLG
jgi:hypothetical protein